jgi:hypothetical protein
MISRINAFVSMDFRTDPQYDSVCRLKLPLFRKILRF